MDVGTLKAKIKSKQLPSQLILTGPEWKVQEIYINQIAKVTQKDIRRIDTVLDIYQQLRNKSFIQTSSVYVVRDDKELMATEKLQDQLPTILGDNMLIHLLTSPDKRTKYYKKYKDSIVEFEPLADAVLKKYIKREVDLSDKNCEVLIDICEHDYGRILLEIDKINRYSIERYTEFNSGVGNDFDSAFQDLVKDGTIYEPPYDAIFDLVGAILDRKPNIVFDLLSQSYEVGEATMVMLSVLYNNTKAVLQVQSYKGDNLSKATGLSGWQIKNAKPHINKYTESELIKMLQLIQKVESGIKTGRMEDEFAMQYLLVHIL